MGLFNFPGIFFYYTQRRISKGGTMRVFFHSAETEAHNPVGKGGPSPAKQKGTSVGLSWSATPEYSSFSLPHLTFPCRFSELAGRRYENASSALADARVAALRPVPRTFSFCSYGRACVVVVVPSCIVCFQLFRTVWDSQMYNL